MLFIEHGLKNNLIQFDEERKYITYTLLKIKRNFHNPEEKVQAESYCRLVFEYGYPANRIDMYVEVTMGVTKKEADIIVYHDDERTQPYIVVECKSAEVSEMEFKEAVKQAHGYAHAIAGTTKYIWITKGNKQEFYLFEKEKNKLVSQATLPYFGETTTKRYRFAREGYYYDMIQGKKTKIHTGDLRGVSEKALTQIFKQAHDALWAGGELNPSQAFDELDKLIFCKVWDERNTKKGEAYQFQITGEYSEESRNLSALKERVIALYDKGKEKDPEIFNKPIDLSMERIKTVVEYFQEISFTKTDLDSKGKAFETFLGTYFRGEFGQYFTPRTVVKFAVEALPINNQSRVLDTSCGSGGFLLYILDKVRRQADAEYNQDDPREAVEHYNYWHDFAKNNLFGIEINDQISRVAKMNMIIHDDGHTNVITFDGLYQIHYIAEKSGNRGFAENSFDFIATNPPFGSIVKQSEKSYMQVDKTTAPYYDFALKDINWIDNKLKAQHTLTGRENQSTEILFIEQCHKFLREGGYMAMVVPDGILTNSSAQYVRDGIEEKFRIVAVISLPGTAFTNTGAGVKSSLLFLRKHPKKTTQNILKTQEKLQLIIARQTNLVKTILGYEQEKKEALKKLKAQPNHTDDQRKTIAKAITDEYNAKIGAFAQQADEAYQLQKQEQLPDYPIFMAIAENIGYDAAGKHSYKVLEREVHTDPEGNKHIREIQENDLYTTHVHKQSRVENGKEVEVYSKETIIAGTGILGQLQDFIDAIEKGTDHFFH